MFSIPAERILHTLGMIAVDPSDFHATQLYILAEVLLCSLSMAQKATLFLTYRKRFYSALSVWGNGTMPR